MAGERLNSEKKIEHSKIKLKIGTIDKNNPKVVYFEGRTFVTPEEDKENTAKDINEIKHSFKKLINEILHESKFFTNKFILDFQVATGGIHYGKKSFLSFQLILSQRDDSIKKLPTLKESANDCLLRIANGLEEEIKSRGYLLSKIKRKTEE